MDLSKSFLTAGSSSGEIYLDRINGKLRINSTSGGIKAENIQLTGDSSFDTTSGNINVSTKNVLDDLSFDLKSNSGSLKVGNNRRSEDRLVLKRGGILVSGRSTSGNISID